MDDELQVLRMERYPHVWVPWRAVSQSGFISTSITNHFIGVDVQLSKISLNGYESMGFDVTSLTQKPSYHYNLPQVQTDPQGHQRGLDR